MNPVRGGGTAGVSSLLRLFIRQDISERFSGSLIGSMWVFLAPLLQLSVFYLVFLQIFGSRVPGMEGLDYLAYLAVGFWPWFAFSEAISRASTAVTGKAALAAKVSLPRLVPVLASVLAAFLLHGLGFVAVVLSLGLLGIDINWIGLGGVALVWLLMLGLATALSVLAATLQVFIRDLGQTIGLLLTLAFFLTPIIYVPSMIEGTLAHVLSMNPMTGLIQSQRALLLPDIVSDYNLWVPLGATAVLLLLATALYFRLRRSIEDFV